MVMKTKIILLILCVLGVCNLHAQQMQSVFPETKKKIYVNNRILAVVNGKAISVLDISKKMDMLFYRQYPQYANSLEAKYKFFTMYWKNALQELIDKELIMLDAEQNKLEISGGDIRQEMETLFGPNILVNLDTAGLTFEEAWEMVSDDITLKRMMGGKVNVLALRMVTPQAVKTAYDEFAKSSAKPEEMSYQVISIRGEDSDACAEIADITYKLLAVEKLPQDQVLEQINTIKPIPENISFKISEEFKHTSKDVSKDYSEALASIETGSYSTPIAQKSRTDSSTVYRIFFLKDITKTEIPSFEEVENKLKERLLDYVIAQETEKYLAKLRKHYDVDTAKLSPKIPEDFQPFALR